MEQMQMQVLLNGQLCHLFTSRQKVKRRPSDHLIKLAFEFVPYVPHISVYMYNKHIYLAVVANYIKIIHLAAI